MLFPPIHEVSGLRRNLALETPAREIQDVLDGRIQLTP